MSPAEHDRIYALHQQGASAREIADDLGRSLSCIYASIADSRRSRGEVQRFRGFTNHLQAGGDGIVPLKPRLPVAVVVHRYLAEESIEALASNYQVSRAAIRSLLVAAGVTIRAKRRSVTDRYWPWTHDESATCLRLRALGHDASVIGQMINRSTLAVRSWLQEHDRPNNSARMVERARRRRGELLPEEMPSDELLEQLRKGWIEGQTVAAMAREFDLPSAIVSGALKRSGILVKRGPKSNRLRQAAAALPPRGMPLLQVPNL
jgi:transposase